MLARAGAGFKVGNGFLKTLLGARRKSRSGGFPDFIFEDPNGSRASRCGAVLVKLFLSPAK
jgi:hypothetical protein